jgi:hypothetical protein
VCVLTLFLHFYYLQNANFFRGPTGRGIDLLIDSTGTDNLPIVLYKLTQDWDPVTLLTRSRYFWETILVKSTEIPLSKQVMGGTHEQGILEAAVTDPQQRRGVPRAARVFWVESLQENCKDLRRARRCDCMREAADSAAGRSQRRTLAAADARSGESEPGAHPIQV